MTLAVIATAVIYVAVLFERRRRYPRPSETDQSQRTRPHVGHSTPDAPRAVGVLRRLGFFSGEEALTGEELAWRLEQRIQAEWGAPVADLARTAAQRDVLIALQDPRRGCRVPDKYFYPGDNAFLEIIAMCARLDGIPTFQPLREEWASPEGPVDVHFSVNGRETSCTIRAPKYVDVNLFRALNAAAPGHARRLRVSDALGMPNLVFALTDDEADTLVRECGWTFHPEGPGP